MIAGHKGEVPFIVYLLPFITGILAGFYFNLPLASITITLGVLCLIFLLLNLLYARWKLYLRPWTGGLLLHLILIAAGFAAVKQYDDRNHQSYFANHPARLLLVQVADEPLLKGKYLHCTAQVLQVADSSGQHLVKGKLLLTIMADSTHHLQYGDQLLIPGNYKPVSPPLNPATFNYKAYLSHQNIYEQSFLYPGQYKIVAKDKGNPVIAASLRLRQRFVEKFKANIRDTDAAAVASTLILGYKADLSQDVLQAYSKTGTIHVLSVSGAHVAIVIVFISFFLSFLDGPGKSKWIKTVLSIILIWAYAMLTGFSPAVCRAALMISMVLIGNSGYRYVNTANLLALSAFILLLYNPFLITDVGFQLSYLAVLGLIMLQPIINSWFDIKNKFVRKLWYYISASIAAQVITFPLSAFYFHQFPVYFLVSNLFIIIPSEAILFLGITAMLLPHIGVVSPALFWVLGQTIILMNKGLAFLEHQPFSSINQVWFTGLECTLLFVAIIAFFYYLYNKRSFYLKTGLFCFLIFAVSLSYGKIRAQQNNTMLFYSVSKHAAILFKHGSTGILLTDVRPDDQAYKYSVLPAIDSNRVTDLKIISPDSSIKTTFLSKRAGLIAFGSTRVLIYNDKMSNMNLPKKLTVDYVYLTGNPSLDLEKLNEQYQYKLLVIDGTNSNARIRKVAAQATSSKIKYVVLPRNKSLIVGSN